MRWCQTTVVLREDILVQAQASGLDINDLCNRALAGAAGILYPPKKPAALDPAEPVIVVHDGGSAKMEQIVPSVASGEIHPVINADDPRAASAVKQVSRPPSPKAPAALPGRVSTPDKKQLDPGTMTRQSPAVKPGKPEKRQEKRGKGSPVKRFVAEAIIREEEDGGHVTKEVLYQAFSRWCREHRVTPVPDRRALTTALKNQFAMSERPIDGEPSWMNIRIR